MANIYNGLIYNDDVDMAAEDNAISPSSIFETIDNISSYTPIEPPVPTVPEVIDLDPSDNLTRAIDGWVPDVTPTGGTPGETYNDIAPTEKSENPSQQTKTLYAQTQIIISDYSNTYLQKLVDAGATFYVVYTDDTRDEVTVSEIQDPHPAIEATIQVETEAIARAINQYFWHDTNGVHVTDTTQTDWADAVADNFSDWPSIPYHNILMNSLGLLLRTQLINLASLSRSGIAFYDGEGNASNNILASFGLNGSLFRADGRDIMRITPNGVVFVPLEGNEISVTMITDNIANLVNTVTSNKSELDLTIANLQAQIDGVVDTYYEEVDPEYTDELTDSNNANVIDSSSNNIEVLIKTPWMYGWKTDDIKAGHEGDLYYNIDTGHAWRWLKIDNLWQWYRIADSDVAEALQIARDANTLAGTKKRVFTTTPTVPYDVGDLWVDGSQVRYATVAKTIGSSYAASDWEQTATDDTTANTALNKANANENNINDLQGEVTVIKRDYVTNATYTANNSIWSANLTSLETTLKTYSDNGITTAIGTEVTNRNAAITAESNSIKQIVSANYATKTELQNESSNRATAIANEVTARNAAIQTSAGNILQQVSESYVDNSTYGTYVNQTNQDITTIIGDQNSVKSIIYKHDAILNEITVEALDKINAYYAANDPIIEDEVITDSFGSDVVDSNDSTVSVYRYLNNSPVYSWNSNYIRNNHVDDLFINTLNSHIWRYTSSYTWEYIENTDVTNAVQQSSQAITDARSASQAATTASQSANEANTLARNKKRVFTTTPTPPYDIGDLWVTGSQTKYSTVARSSGNYNAFDWQVTSTDDTNLDLYKNTIATIIRETTSGVLVAKASSSIGTLQGSSNFQIVGINSWSDSTPTIGNTYALFGANGLSVYDNTGTNVVAFFGVENSLPFSRIGRVEKGNIQIGVNDSGNGYIDLFNNNVLLAHFGYDAGMNDSGVLSNAPYYTFGSRQADYIIGNYSFAEGYETTASGYISHAEGCETTASGPYSHAEGHETTASSDSAHAEGYQTTASRFCSHAEGYGTVSSMNCTHAEGHETTASGQYSHAEGYKTTASNISSHAEGYLTNAVGLYSHAEGFNTAANSAYSHAEGFKTVASHGCTHAEGCETTASGQYSHAEGYQTTASGTYSHSSGNHTVAGYANQFACGRYNSNNSNDLFEVGNGSSYASSNAFRVTTSNTAYMGSTAVTSDKRIKIDLGELDTNQAINFIKSLMPHKYEKFGRKELGFFAQDIEQDPNYGDVLVEQYPDHGYEDFRSLSYDGIIAPIVSTLQNILTRLEKLEMSAKNG